MPILVFHLFCFRTKNISETPKQTDRRTGKKRNAAYGTGVWTGVDGRSNFITALFPLLTIAITALTPNNLARRPPY